MSTSELLGGSPFDVGVLTQLANAILNESPTAGPASPPSSASLPSAVAPGVAGGLPPEFASPPHGRSPSGSLPSELRGLDAGDPLPGAASPTGAVPKLAQPESRSSASPYYFLDHAPSLPSFPAVGTRGAAGLTTQALAAPSSKAYDLTSYVPTHYLPQGALPSTGVNPAAEARLLSGVSSVVAPALGGALDIAKVRSDFPILSEQVNGKQLVWLDNAATTQKPKAVIERLSHFYAHENSNIHRAAHELAARSTDAYEGAREKVRAFLGARSTNEIVFVRGTTEGINLIASAWGRQNIKAGDEIVLSHLEHHANIVPWQLLAQEKGAKIRVIPVDDDGQILLSEYGRLLGPRTKLVSFTQVSNALGTITPAREMVAMAKAMGITTLVDGAQSVSHMPTDVQSLGADFFVFSGHKVFGPTGIGAVWGREELLNRMAPYQGGGNMIQDVTFERTLFHPAPARFEAGTGNIADAVGLGAALDYLNGFGMAAIAAYEHSLLEYGTRLLEAIPGLRLIGTAPHKASVLSFTLAGFRTDEVSSRLNDEGIAVRGGHHCAQPILRRFGLESTVRPSLAFYNDCSDLDRLAAAVTKIAESRSTKSFVP